MLCCSCIRSLELNCRSRESLTNYHWLGSVPTELQDLTWIEEMLITRTHVVEQILQLEQRSVSYLTHRPSNRHPEKNLLVAQCRPFIVRSADWQILSTTHCIWSPFMAIKAVRRVQYSSHQTRKTATVRRFRSTPQKTSMFELLIIPRPSTNSIHVSLLELLLCRNCWEFQKYVLISTKTAKTEYFLKEQDLLTLHAAHDTWTKLYQWR